jgi:predicted RNase H-like HicB family nuclease
MKHVFYKGFTGVYAHVPAEEQWVGRIVGIKDIIIFRGDGIEDAEQSFRILVDAYIQANEVKAEKPEPKEFDYYRLLTGEGYSDFKEGRIYPSNYKFKESGCSTIELVRGFPWDWSGVSYSDYVEQSREDTRKRFSDAGREAAERKAEEKQVTKEGLLELIFKWSGNGYLDFVISKGCVIMIYSLERITLFDPKDDETVMIKCAINEAPITISKIKALINALKM